MTLQERKAAAQDIVEERVPAIQWAFVGSCLIVENPGDIDVLCLVHDLDTSSTNVRNHPDVEDCYSGKELGRPFDSWAAYRFGDVNLILTGDVGYYDRFLVASNVCRALNLTQKRDRCRVHRIVRDGYHPEELEATDEELF